jgi:prolyl oligopeptidase
MENLTYPETPAGDDVDTAAGLFFPDPYRWLEGRTEAVRLWDAAQNNLARGYIRQWPCYESLHELVSKYSADYIDALSRYTAGKWFRAVQATNARDPHVVVSDTPYGTGRIIPVGITGARETSSVISWVCPSTDGRTLAVGVCPDGSERNRIHLLDVASGESVAAPPLPLMDAWTGGVCWLPDGSGFYYLALDGKPDAFRQVVLFHNVADGTQSAARIPLPAPNSTDYTLISVSSDGRYLIATHGLFAPKPIAILDLNDTQPTWRPFITNVVGTVVGTVVKGTFIALTDVDASRGRIVAIPLDTDCPDNATRWTTLVPETEVVLRSVTAVGDELYITGFLDTFSTLRVAHLDGSKVQEVRLPTRAVIEEPLFPLMNLIPRGHPKKYFFVCSSLTESWAVYCHHAGASRVELVRAPEVHIEGAMIEDHWAMSLDGTRVPYHTVRLRGSELPAPGLLYVYGAFNIPLLPGYPGPMAAFVAAGGIFVHGHIRGGAELGRDWWHGGRMKNKHKGFADLYAIAEDAAKRGLTDSARLALTGRSNGGLMACVAVAQRPELWRAVVPQVPVTDLIGVLRDRYGCYAVSQEYADPHDQTEAKRLSGFSPYHMIRHGTRYPPVLIEAGATDPRCPPWHARKMAARLQQAENPANSPTLVRIRENVGHGIAERKCVQVDSATEWLAFVMQELGMDPRQTSVGGD